MVFQNAVLRIPKRIDYAAIPWTTFTDPELASVGVLADLEDADGAGSTRILKPRTTTSTAPGSTAGRRASPSSGRPPRARSWPSRSSAPRPARSSRSSSWRWRPA